MALHQKAIEHDHILVLNEKAEVHEDGLILGNGDLSVSIYQKNSEIVWRFGKGDVWDRRHATENDPDPMTIDELRKGIRDEGWVSGPCGGRVKALRGAEDPKRTCEVLQATESRSYPYPMAKPVGELSLHWPADLQGLKITQKLFITEARVEIRCEWIDGERLDVNCFIHPELNVLVVRWNLSGFNSGPPQPFFQEIPVWLSLYRWPDPDFAKFSAKWKADFNCPAFDGMNNDKATPLAPPEVIAHDNKFVIQQKFYPDNIFPDGFRYWMGCITDQPGLEKCDTGPLDEARILVTSEPPQDYEKLLNGWVGADRQLRDGVVDYPSLRDYSGYIAIPVTTSSDDGGCEQEYRRICKILESDTGSVLEEWEDDNYKAAQKFWSASGLTVAEKTIENLWYETLHVSKCVYKKGTVPPGLFLPSCLNDYSLWKSDYHTNYNFQQCFWGFFTANHLELTESYFSAMEYLTYIGQKIAKDCFDARGTFIQICAYPMLLDQDPVSTTPMARMTYMTGWSMQIYWWYYVYTNDINFLRERGYPFIRDCALFYTDFLELGKDGYYHAFPSSFGEQGFTGDPESNTDSVQTIIHCEACLKTAIKAAKLLGVDGDLQEQWQDRVDKLAPGKGESEWEPLPEASEAKHKNFNVPEFLPAEWYRFPFKWSFAKRRWNWIQFLPWSLMRDVRGGQFVPSRDFDELIQLIKRWRHMNGLLWPMPTRFWGRQGPMTEILGIIAPLQEMLLQSWDGSIRIFPAWPNDVDADFVRFRAEGAFLVSASQTDGCIGNVTIESLAGSRCTLASPWPDSPVRVIEEDSGNIILDGQLDAVIFDTQKEKVYRIESMNQ